MKADKTNYKFVIPFHSRKNKSDPRRIRVVPQHARGKQNPPLHDSMLPHKAYAYENFSAIFIDAACADRARGDLLQRATHGFRTADDSQCGRPSTTHCQKFVLSGL